MKTLQSVCRPTAVRMTRLACPRAHTCDTTGDRHERPGRAAETVDTVREEDSLSQKSSARTLASHNLPGHSGAGTQWVSLSVTPTHTPALRQAWHSLTSCLSALQTPWD